MSSTAIFMWLIPALPLLASIVITAAALKGGRGWFADRCHIPCIAGAVGACVCAIATFIAVANGDGTPIITGQDLKWISVGDFTANFSLRADGLTAIMLVMVTFIGSLIAIYSAGYMHGDPGYPRFFAAVSLFLFFMTGLVLANNFVLLYACWEGVGLCSYLLIGFWFAKPSAAAAARKAFLVTRLGDIGLLVGIMMLWTTVGYSAETKKHSLEYDDVFAQVKLQYDDLTKQANQLLDKGRIEKDQKAISLDLTSALAQLIANSRELESASQRHETTRAQEQLLTEMHVVMELTNAFSWSLFLACLCLFIGAAGKSAQFPLHVWLPDAMEGPSPVSALIHAATMVTAGVYLIARCTPLFGIAPAAQLLVACIGGFTALLAALIAVTQTDLKRVLAYSTLSQLGYMFLALGCGIQSGKLAALAVTAAIFHLFTHAFFKALLFLAAGSVMHAMGDVIDMRRFSGLRKALPITHWTFLAGAAALAGFPLLSGFWSKDEILAAAYEAHHHSPYSTVYFILFISALFTAGLTAFYTGRAYFMTFWGDEKFPHEAGHHPHEAPAIMAWPLRILAGGAIGVGIVLGPLHLFVGFLEAKWMTPQFPGLMPAEPHPMNLALMAASSVIALAGIGIAYWMYVKQTAVAPQLARRMSALYEASLSKFYFDEIYELLIVRPMSILSHVCRIVDAYFIDGLVDLVGQMPAFLGYLVRPVQNGLVQFYALLMALGLAGFLLSVLLKW